MPRYSLKDMAKRARPGIRRKAIVLRDIDPPGTLATNLYRGSYLPVIQVWSAAAERIIAAYAATVSEMTTDAPADVKAEIDGAAEQVNRLVLLLTPEVRSWALSVESWQRKAWRGAVLAATSVDLDTILSPEDVRASLATHIEWNVALIKDISAQAQQRISNAVFDGLRNRTPARDVAKAIREATGMARRRSVNVASDQLAKITSALADERRRDAGITAWEWVHGRKAHPRVAHVERNGNYYSDVAGDVGQTINGKTLLAPPEDRPGQLPFCSCRSRAVIDLSD